MKRKYLNIHLNDHSVQTEEWEGEALVKAGRYLIAQTLVDCGAASADLSLIHI